MDKYIDYINEAETPAIGAGIAYLELRGFIGEEEAKKLFETNADEYEITQEYGYPDSLLPYKEKLPETYKKYSFKERFYHTPEEWDWDSYKFEELFKTGDKEKILELMDSKLPAPVFNKLIDSDVEKIKKLNKLAESL